MRHLPDPLLHDPSCHPQVGAPDPARHTSPIVDAGESLGEVLPNEYLHHCVFNDAVHAIGDTVQSDAEILCCAAPGVWVRQPPAGSPTLPPARSG